MKAAKVLKKVFKHQAPAAAWVGLVISVITGTCTYRLQQKQLEFESTPSLIVTADSLSLIFSTDKPGQRLHYVFFDLPSQACESIRPLEGPSFLVSRSAIENQLASFFDPILIAPDSSVLTDLVRIPAVLSYDVLLNGRDTFVKEFHILNFRYTKRPDTTIFKFEYDVLIDKHDLPTSYLDINYIVSGDLRGEFTRSQRFVDSRFEGLLQYLELRKIIDGKWRSAN